jgi:hypothetical protein
MICFKSMDDPIARATTNPELLVSYKRQSITRKKAARYRG